MCLVTLNLAKFDTQYNIPAFGENFPYSMIWTRVLGEIKSGEIL